MSDAPFFLPGRSQQKDHRRQRVSGRRRILSLSLPLVLVGLLIFAACSSTTPTATPTQTPTPTPAPQHTEYPVTVTDLMGRSVEIAQKPASIVTTHPTSTETLYRAGGTAVARDTTSKYPAEVQDLPTIGSAYSLDMEALAALNPDLVLIEALTQARFMEPLGNLGLTVVAVRATSLDDITQSLTLVGTITDTNETTAQAISEIEDRIDAAKTMSDSGKSILVLISDADRNIYASKTESYPGEVAALLGLGNVASGLPESGPYPGFALFTGEQALISNPDAVFTISPAPPPAPRLSDMLQQVPGFNQMTAVQEGRVSEIDPVLFLQAQGPRIADAVEEMLRILNEVAP